MRFSFVLVLAFACFCAPFLRAQDALDVASYNLRFNHVRQNPENTWDMRKERVRELFRYYDFDVVGTQEPVMEQVEYVAELKQYGVIATPRGDFEGEVETCAIFYKKARLKLLDSGTFWLSQTPDFPSHGKKAKSKRICTWGKFEDLKTKKTFFLFNTHLHASSKESREESTRVMMEQIPMIAGAHPVFITGDFNARLEEDSLKTILNTKSFFDSRLVSVSPPYGPEATFNGFKETFEHSEKLTREEAIAKQGAIDHIFVSPKIRVLKYAVITDSYYWKYPSDHFPVLIKAVLE